MAKTLVHKKQFKSSNSDFIVRIKSGEGVSIKGKVEHIHTGQVHYFNDFLELILLMQNKLDHLDYPQCDTELRTFD
ncbi:MAG: hypothetical protein SCJ94_02150 [Bacillota bacterium]|nr:hypothetical protein [Bacillota bacterium]